MRTTLAACLSTTLVAAALGPAAAQHPHDQHSHHQHSHEHGAPATRVGKVHFETSCQPAVRDEFDRGVALLHSFWFSAAIDAFEGVLQKDPDCAIAHWGIALSWWSNPFGGYRSSQALEAGLAAIAASKSKKASERERAYLDAAEKLFANASTVDQRSRAVAYEKALEALAKKHPEDVEARIFYALALDQTALPTDKTYANQLKAAEILEREFELQPEHPGLAHYIIHSYDVPALAPRALEAARRYAKIAPDAAHALHMPSHTFTRVGAWEESIEANNASAAAARKDSGAVGEELHALDYQMYAYLQTAQDDAAENLLERVPQLRNHIQSGTAGNAAPLPAGYYAAAAMPARYALERNAWSEAAKLEVRQTPFAWADAVTHYARALGAARSGDPESAAKDAKKLAELRDSLIQAKDSYWSEQVDIQYRAASAWVEFSRGRREEGLAMLRVAADKEDATEKHAVTPGPIKPARELLGEMLLEMDRPDDALVAFETTLKKEPNRYRAVYGAQIAAAKRNDSRKVAAYQAQLLQITTGAPRPERAGLR
jgi:hypothetical protein